MKIITKKVAETAQVIDVQKLELPEMQALVGGLIQPIYNDDTIIWCNDEGKLLGMDVNIVLNTSPLGEIIDTVHGDIFITNSEEGSEGLNVQQIQSLLTQLNEGIRTFARADMHIVPILTLK